VRLSRRLLQALPLINRHATTLLACE